MTDVSAFWQKGRKAGLKVLLGHWHTYTYVDALYKSGKFNVVIDE